MIATSNRFYKYIKDKPKWIDNKPFSQQSRDARQFMMEEARKIKKGIVINGVKIHPWTYWHVNFWHMLIDKKVPGEPLPVPTNDISDLRDNEWLLQQALFKAEEQKKGIVGFGCRRAGKSAFISSFVGHSASTKYGGDIMVDSVIGGSQEDLDNITGYLDHGFKHIHPFFKMDLVGKDWGKGVTLGTRNSDNTKDIFSTIKVTNFNKGAIFSSQKTAGQTPKSAIFDEIGKAPFMKTFNAFKYSIETPFGWRTTPLLFGCLTKNNFVWTNDGDIVPIHKLKTEDGIIGFDSSKGQYSEEPIIHRQGEYKKKCVKITTESGRTIECSDDHPILTKYRDKSKWHAKLKRRYRYAEFVESKDLNVGDTICVVDSLPKFGEETLGNLRLIGQTVNSKDKLPLSTFRLTKEALSELLGGIFDVRGKVKPSIRLVMEDRKLLELISLALLKFGIHGVIKEKVKGKKGYIFYINEFYSIERFYKNIKFTDKDKQDRLDTLYTNHKGIGVTLCKKNPYLQGVRSERIVSIEDIGEQYVYNLTAGATNTYLAGAIITHNTGSVAEFSRDSQKMVNNPDAYGMINMDWSWIGEDGFSKTWVEKTWGVFMPAQMSLGAGITKQESNLSKFLRIDSSELEEIKINVTKWKESTSILEEKRSKLKKTDLNAYNDEVIFMPLDPDDCFLDAGKNPFPVAEANKQLNKIRLEGDVGRFVDVFPVDNERHIEVSDTKKPIAAFPFEGGILDCGIKIFEMPPEDNSFDYTYVAGLDHYKHTESTGDSIGALYIIKRKVNINDEFSDSIVCSFCSRPPSINTFNRTLEILIEAYGAQCLQENADISFQQYLEAKGKDIKLLANGQEIVQRMISSDARQVNKFGLSPTAKNKEYYIGLVVAYCWEPLESYIDKDGEERSILGIERIKDEELLEEIIAYKPGKNVDRITAFGHALVWARYLDDIRVIPPVKGRKKEQMSREQYEVRRETLQTKVRHRYGTGRTSRGSRYRT